MLLNKALQRTLLWIFAIIIVSSPIRFAAADEVNIYSHRQKFLLEPFLQVFEKQTGIKTNVLYASKGLAQRLAAEGEASPADVVLTVDIARLSEYVSLDLFQIIQSETPNCLYLSILDRKIIAGLVYPSVHALLFLLVIELVLMKSPHMKI